VAREDAMQLARTRFAAPIQEKCGCALICLTKIGGPIEQQNVVGEIRGYEKRMKTSFSARIWIRGVGHRSAGHGCNAALVIEAARAIKATGLLPRAHNPLRPLQRRGTRYDWLVRYCESAPRGARQDPRDDHYDAGVGRVTGYSLGGRRDIEAGVREVLKPFGILGREQSYLRPPRSHGQFDFSARRRAQPGGESEEAN